ncbi:MAG: glycosyltransferase, partial [Thermoleophilaceae bacterium]
MRTVHQVLSGAGPYDAVSVQGRLWRRLLRARGFAGEDYAATVDPRAVRDFRSLKALRAEPGDLIVIRYSAYSSKLLPLLELPNRRLLVYHNVTPPRYLWNHHATVAVACAVGRVQLPRFARAATLAVGDSDFNAAELRAAGAGDARTLPILFDAARLGETGTPPAPGAGPLVLVVSRLAPNKRHDLVIAAFAAWRAERCPAARLLVVGEALSPSYLLQLERIAEASGAAAAITFAGALSQRDLNAAYGAADVLLSMSEHEGFSVPLLEAFHFGVPVLARPAGAMPEIGGDAVLWDRGEDVAVTAELLELAVRDEALRVELVLRGRKQLERFSYERTAAAT